MNTVYGVSHGNYSDYTVLFLCADKKLAEKSAAALRGESDGWYRDAGVEGFVMFDEPPKQVTVYTMQALVKDGEVLGSYGRIPEPKLTQKDEWEWDTDAKQRPSVRVYTAPVTGPKAKNITVHGTDKSGVLKAYSDRITQMLAEEAL